MHSQNLLSKKLVKRWLCGSLTKKTNHRLIILKYFKYSTYTRCSFCKTACDSDCFWMRYDNFSETRFQFINLLSYIRSGSIVWDWFSQTCPVMLTAGSFTPNTSMFMFTPSNRYQYLIPVRGVKTAKTSWTIFTPYTLVR